MTSQELYYEFHLLFNKNASYQNIDVSKGNFVHLYNRELLRWLSDYILRNNSTQKIHDVQGLLTVNEKLELSNRNDRYDSFELPEQFFEFVDCISEVEKGGCKIKIINYIEKPKDALINLDTFAPSFNFEEGLCNISKEKVLVYVGDFKINATYLSYYQKPTKIDLAGYEKIDGSLSSNIDSDLDERFQGEVLDRVVLEVMRQFENGNGHKLSQDRIINK